MSFGAVMLMYAMINIKTKWDNDNAKTLLSKMPIVMQELAHGVTLCPPTSSCRSRNTHPPKVIVATQYITITCHETMLRVP